MNELQEIRQAFAVEGEELLTEVERSLLRLEAHPDNADEFNRLFRAVHTLKGSAGIVGFIFLEQFCHDVECLLVRIREDEQSLSPFLITLLLKCHDHIKKIINGYFLCEDLQYSPPPIHYQLLESLKELYAAPAPDVPDPDEAEDGFDVRMAVEDASLDVTPDNLDFLADNGVGAFQDSLEHTPGIVLDLASTVSAPEPAAAERKVVRVDAAKLDQLIDLVVELVTATSVMEAKVRQLKETSAIEASSLVSTLAKHVQEKSMSFRMAPVHILFRRFQRVVQDSARKTGKLIRLEISGGETELEKIVAEKLSEPLLHLVRNAIDHGIELPEERAKKGKNPKAKLCLNAFQDAGNVVIEVTDDGRGIDRARVMGKALGRGLIKPGVEPSVRDLLNILCAPGFSTLDQASLLSGRGVGMDSVKMVIESLRGRIDLESTEGTGTTFRFRIPLSLSVIDGFMVAVGETSCILPMELVLETLEIDAREQSHLHSRGYINLRDSVLPCIPLQQIFNTGESSSRFIIVVKHSSGRTGLVVDRFLGETKAVIKPLGRLYQNVSYVSGATILSDGTIALLLEIDMLTEKYKSMI